MCADVIPSVSEESASDYGKSGFFGRQPQNDYLRRIGLTKSEQLLAVGYEQPPWYNK